MQENVLDQEQKNKQVLNKILRSDSFKDRELYQRLLTYLVDASAKGDTPKEVTIAHDVFNKGKDFNASEDTTVRVHVHNLRKMIEHYYQTEGQSDEIQLIIPKGHYRVEYKKDTTSKIFSLPKKNNLAVLLLALSLFSSLLYIVVDKFMRSGANSYFEKIERDDVIWGNFFSNKYPTSVVIGDFLVFHEFSAQLDRPRRIQDYEINTLDELDLYIKANPDKNIENWFLGELPHNSIFNISDIYNVFFSFHQKLDINFTSEIDINFIKNRNIIYIGEFKNLRALSDLTDGLPVKYETLPWWHGTLCFKNNDSLITLRTSHDWNINRYVVDLASVAKLPGQNDENYLIIAGFGYNSQIKTVKMLSDYLSLQKLEKQINLLNGNVPEFFVIVFEISGFDRASTKAEIKFFQEIDKEEYQKSFQISTN